MKTLSLNLRPFDEHDYPAFVELYNLIHPDSPKTVKELKYFNKTRQKDILLYEVLDYQDKMMAALFAMKADVGKGQVRLDLYLHPKQSNTVLREKLYAALRQKLAYAKALTTRVREDWQDLRAFYEQKGFIEVERQWESRLDVTVFDPQPFRSVLDKAQAAGIVFKTLADVMTETLEPVKAIQCLMYQTITQDLLPSVPFAEPLEIWDFDTWLERYWHAPERCFESVFMAFAKDEFVGMSELYQAEDVTKLKNGLTAVKEKHRRKGIATSLKLKAALYAKSKGIKEIVTTNHSINRPMLAINEAMGFVKDPAWIRLKKEINS